ncbi:helix-turn-helix domain-containing protein [Saccharothrix longispora]|uniref:MarR family transcriptional regulator n=1 Tax=Saccharothrix longispora TaxID=33920 RepID=UPI0028FD14CA|nr:helix-turn-helix domain-containing protein [Saccharothrix longispora]MDU0294155.1 helix-turn-helix domain-containing protein [Saccharothrix longispora]
MSTNTNTNTNPTLRAVPDLVKPRTDTEEKLWQALLDNPGSTATALSVAAGIGKSTAQKILARWEKDDLVTRTAGVADGGPRPADRWSITPTGEEPTSDEVTDDQPTDHRTDAETEAQASGETKPKSERLAPGALRGLIEDYLRENAGQDFSPNAIGKALNRSSGAVFNALEKLIESGYAVRTSDKPKKYSLAADSGAGSGM